MKYSIPFDVGNPFLDLVLACYKKQPIDTTDVRLRRRLSLYFDYDPESLPEKLPDMILRGEGIQQHFHVGVPIFAGGLSWVSKRILRITQNAEHLFIHGESEAAIHLCGTATEMMLSFELDVLTHEFQCAIERAISLNTHDFAEQLREQKAKLQLVRGSQRRDARAKALKAGREFFCDLDDVTERELAKANVARKDQVYKDVNRIVNRYKHEVEVGDCLDKDAIAAWRGTAQVVLNRLAPGCFENGGIRLPHDIARYLISQGAITVSEIAP
jgi:hypothetical protein